MATPLTVTLDGVGMTSPTQSAVRLTAPGYTFAVEDVVIDPGQVDTVVFSAGVEGVTYTTLGSETPLIELGLSLDGDDYLFQITSVAETMGVSVSLVADVANGTLKVRLESQDGSAAYAIRVHRLSNAAVVFGHAGSQTTSATTVLIRYRQWPGQGAPMTFDLDQDSNGTVDQTVMVTDDLD